MLTGLALAAFASGASAASPAPCAYTAGPATIAVEGHPFAAEPSADGCWLFVSLSGEAGGRGGVAVLHNEGGHFAVVRTVRLASAATGLALTHDGGRLLMASGDAVRVFDVERLRTGATDAEIGRLRDGDGAGAIYVAVSQDDRLVFASDEGAARITVFDLARAGRDGFDRHAVVGRIPQGTAPVGLALSADGVRLYATSQRAASSAAFPSRCRAEATADGPLHPEGALSVIDVARAATDPAHALIAAIPAGCNPVRVTLSGDGRTAWVTARGENAVYLLALGNLPRVSRHRIPVGDSPVGMAVQPGTDRLWISNSGRFSTAQGDVQSVPVGASEAVHVKSGRFPRDLRFLPDGRTLVVAVFGSQAVQLIPVPG